MPRALDLRSYPRGRRLQAVRLARVLAREELAAQVPLPVQTLELMETTGIGDERDWARLEQVLAIPEGTLRRSHLDRSRPPELRRESVALPQVLLEYVRKHPLPGEAPVPVARRPQTLGECRERGLGTTYPCPFVSCQYHPYLSVDEQGRLILHHPDEDPTALPVTCSAQVLGERTQEATAEVLGISRQRVAQLEAFIREKLQPLEAEVGDEDG